MVIIATTGPTLRGQPAIIEGSFPARTIVRRATVFLCLSFLFHTLPSFSSPQGVALPEPTAASQHDDDEPPIPEQLKKDMEKKANLQRQAELKRDAEKLLKLSTELKEYVDKTNENVMSVEVIKKADEIEKLAHSVKTKMRGDS